MPMFAEAAETVAVIVKRRRGRPPRRPQPDAPAHAAAEDDPRLVRLAACAHGMTARLRESTPGLVAPTARESVRAWARAAREVGISTARLRLALELLVHEHVPGAREARPDEAPLAALLAAID